MAGARSSQILAKLNTSHITGLASMMKYFLNSKSLLLLIALSLAIWGYFVLLGYIGDPRVADSSLGSDEMHIWETLLFSLSLFSLLYLWGCSTVHCFKNKSKLFAVIIAFIWPLSYLYSLYILGSNFRKIDTR